MKAQAQLTPQQARDNLYAQGISISEWARREGFSKNLVFTILQGRRLCRFGKSHEVAIKLGLKVGNVSHD